MDALVIDRIRKTFRGDLSKGAREVLRGVSFFAREGEILGFLGSNGAGKTTTIKIILGLVRPDSGSASILGKKAGESGALARIGYLPENPWFFPHLSLGEFLGYCGRMSGLSGKLLAGKCEEVISLVGLERSAGQRLKSFSKGMLQRAGLAQAVLHDPDLLVLDEPFSGLDPLGRKMVRDILLDLRKKGRTIFFSSHILPDMESLCDRACILRGGVVVKNVSIDEIFRIGEGRVEITARGCAETAIRALADYIDGAGMTGDEAFITVKKQEYVRTVVQHLYNNGAEILKVVNQHRTLEDVFIGEIAGTREGGKEAGERPMEEIPAGNHMREGKK